MGSSRFRRQPLQRNTVFQSWRFRLLASIAMVVSFAAGASASPGFVYALRQVNGAANQVYGFNLDSNSGALTLLPGFPISSGGIGGAGSFSEHMAYKGGLLFVVNEAGSSLSVFSVNPTSGALTAAPYSPVAVTGDLACGA